MKAGKRATSGATTGATTRGLVNEESYVERRKLFRNIWETALELDEKEEQKPRLIRTLRLDTDSKTKKNIARRKEKLKNLRHVCNKILDFCDAQEAEEFILDDKPGTEAAAESLQRKNDSNKSTRRNKRVRKLHTLYSPTTAITKIKFKHPPPPLDTGDHHDSRIQNRHKHKVSICKKKHNSVCNLPPLIDKSPGQSSIVSNRKPKVIKRRKVRKLKTRP